PYAHTRSTTYDPYSFTSCSGSGRDLPSFPTRRSSDLRAEPPPVQPRRLAVRRLPCGRRGAFLRTPFVQRHYCSADAWREPTRWRSEEHTSELQSREKLVCRLLLVKKKSKHNVLKQVDA